MKRVVLTFIIVVLLCPAAHAITINFGGTITQTNPYFGAEVGDTFTGHLIYDPTTGGTPDPDGGIAGVEYSWSIQSGDYYYEFLDSAGLGYVMDDFSLFHYQNEGVLGDDRFRTNALASSVLNCSDCVGESALDIDFAGSWFGIAFPIYYSPCLIDGIDWTPTGITGTIDWQWEKVPEPTSIFFLGAGLVGLFGLGRKKFNF
ncbi:MAG: PEP-CTERM sorting domain-containing protein [Desulfobacteraceae bacterium]|jgi:hypothetical protein